MIERMDYAPTKKSLGQHWLHDAQSLDAMCEMAGVEKGDVVLEIGPGLGTLTQKLIEREAEVVALEFDQSLIAPLQKKFEEYPSTRFCVEQGDIRTYNFINLPPDYKVVANIPYYLTSHLVQLLSETQNPPSSATLLIQKEVAERLCAEPGDMSLLGVSAQLHFTCSLGPIVPARLFTPPPKVDSQIVHLQRRTDPYWGEVDKKLLLRIIKAGFSNRRKTLHNSLAAGLHITKDQALDLLENARINPKARPQELSLDEWIALARVCE